MRPLRSTEGATSGSKQGAKFISGHLTVTKDLHEKPGSDEFTGVERDNGHAAVGVLENVVPATDPRHDKPDPGEGGDQFAGARPR